MTLEQCQCYRLNTRVCKVPIHLNNNESFVFLDHIHDKYGRNIRSFNLNYNPLTFVRNDRGERAESLQIRAVIDEIIDYPELQESGIDQKIHDKLDCMDEKIEKILELAEFTVPRLFIVVPDETSKLNQVIPRIFNSFSLFKYPYNDRQIV